MNVTCDRCKTRYEFDLALVSSRGTTVKCTTCGHRFRVQRPEGTPAFVGWTIRKPDGSVRRYHAMRELQAAIASMRATDEDMLVSDDGSPAQRLGSIPELKGLFRAGEAEPSKRSTPPASGPRAAASLSAPPPRSVGPASAALSLPPPEEREALIPSEPSPTAPRRLPSRRPPAPPLEGMRSRTDDADSHSDSERQTIASALPDEIRVTSLESGASIVRPSALRGSQLLDPRFSEFGRRSARPGFGRWSLGLVVLGMIGIAGISLLKRIDHDARSSRVTQADDERVTAWVAEGEALLREGDLDGARERFTKASAIAETDPRVSRALARTAIAVADRVWLRARIAGRDPEELARVVERTAIAVAGAVASAPDDSLTSVLQIDLHRIQGRLTEARRLVSRVNVTDPAAGRALAMLELCESEPSWDTVLDRLQTATAAEHKLGHARPVLVYALARRGNGPGAQREFEKLVAFDPSHPLIEPLRTLVVAAGGSVSDGPLAAVDVSTLDAAGAAARGQDAQRRGNHDEAERMFLHVLSRDRTSLAARMGLAEVARARGEVDEADKRYRAVLAQDARFVPALVGLADLRWQQGDTRAALDFYQRVIANAPDSDVAAHARDRIEEARRTNGGFPWTVSAPVTEMTGGRTRTPTPSPEAEPTANEGPGAIDTTDLSPDLH